MNWKTLLGNVVIGVGLIAASYAAGHRRAVKETEQCIQNCVDSGYIDLVDFDESCVTDAKQFLKDLSELSKKKNA